MVWDSLHPASVKEIISESFLKIVGKTIAEKGIIRYNRKSDFDI